MHMGTHPPLLLLDWSGIGTADRVPRSGRRRRLAWAGAGALFHATQLWHHSQARLIRLFLRRSASFIGFANKHGTALLHTEAWLDYYRVEQTLVCTGVHFLCMVAIVVGIPESRMFSAGVRI
jgi:hypothetical protein